MARGKFPNWVGFKASKYSYLGEEEMGTVDSSHDFRV
jgi:hypothetical protein